MLARYVLIRRKVKMSDHIYEERFATCAVCRRFIGYESLDTTSPRRVCGECLDEEAPRFIDDDEADRFVFA